LSRRKQEHLALANKASLSSERDVPFSLKGEERDCF
jgi:hypothetical protein